MSGSKRGDEDKDGGRGGSRGEPGSPARLLALLASPKRRQIARLLDSADEPLSPTKMANELSDDVATTSYHAKRMERDGGAGLVGVRKVRGAVEHFYESKMKGNELVLTILELTEEEDEHYLGR